MQAYCNFLYKDKNIEVLFKDNRPVTQRIKEMKQPRGGFLPRKTFKKETFGDGELDYFQNINIATSIVGLIVDYLTRIVVYQKYTKKSLDDIQKEAFSISLKGAARLGEQKLIEAMLLLKDIKVLDDVSIINACILSGFDCIYRSGFIPEDPFSSINPNKKAIKMIKVLVERTLNHLTTKKFMI